MMAEEVQIANAARLDTLPALPGAYLLLIRLDTTIAVQLGRRPPRNLPPGLYAYGGSAYGPGGLRARVSRHARDGKRRHWHVDAITEAGRIAAVAWIVGGCECDLVAWAAARPGAVIPAAGFGSSDCRRCTAHLVRLADDLDAAMTAIVSRVHLR